MNSDTMTILILIGIAILLVSGIIALAVNRTIIGNFASLSVYHDFQTKDKQDAIEIVIETKASKMMDGDDSGKGMPE